MAAFLVTSEVLAARLFPALPTGELGKDSSSLAHEIVLSSTISIPNVEKGGLLDAVTKGYSYVSSHEVIKVC